MLALRNTRRLTEREKRLLLTLMSVGLLVALLWRPIQQQWLAALVVHAEAPAQTVVDELLDNSKNRGRLLNRLWNSEKVPHRLAALKYLRTHPETASALLAQLDSLISAAARDGDIQVRELALGLLAEHQHADLLRLAKAQLHDADPAIRVFGLQYLNKFGNSRMVPLIVPLLDDRDPRATAMAGVTLRKWTGNDFGVSLSQALPKFNANPLKETSPADLEALQRGVHRWKEWWELHRTEYPTQQEAPSRASEFWSLPLPDYSLEDLNGKQIRLSDFRESIVLLTFLDTETANSLIFLSNLVEVQLRNSQRLSVLAVSLNGTHAEHKHEHGHAHGGRSQSQQPSSSQLGAKLRQIVQDKGINYPVLIDSKDTIGYRFSATEYPTSVLIDRDGCLRRRFIGIRKAGTLEAMIDEIDALKPGLK